MEIIFGAIIGLPIAFLVSGLYAKFSCWLGSNHKVLWLGVVVLSSFVVVAIGIEIGLIVDLGIVMAHDKFHPLLDRLQGLSVLLGPAALANLTVAKLRSNKIPADTTKSIAWIVCFFSILCVAASSELYEEEAHYRTDSEGTYRIKE